MEKKNRGRKNKNGGEGRKKRKGEGNVQNPGGIGAERARCSAPRGSAPGERLGPLLAGARLPSVCYSPPHSPQFVSFFSSAPGEPEAEAE